MNWRKMMGKPKPEEVRKLAERMQPALDEVLSRPVDGPLLAKAREERWRRIREKSMKLAQGDVIRAEAEKNVAAIEAQANVIDIEIKAQENLIAWLERNPEAEAHFSALLASGAMTPVEGSK